MKRKRFQAYLPLEYYERLREIAFKSRTSVNALIIQALKDYLEKIRNANYSRH